MPDIWAGIRWQFLSNQTGLGATGTSMVLSRPCRLYAVRGVTRTAAGYAMLYDSTNTPTNPVISLNPGVGVPDNGWETPYHIELKNGLYVSFSMGVGGFDLAAGWERQ